MTSGIWDTGFANPGPNSFRARKQWTGGDGRTWSDGLEHRSPKWNAHNMSHYKWSCGPGDGKIRYTRWVGGPDYSDYLYPLASAPSLSTWDAAMELKLLSDLTKSVKSHDFHIGVSLAEVDKFASMVTSSLGKITRGAYELSRGNVSGAFRAWGTTQLKASQGIKSGLKSKDISGKFLELSYGWIPTVHDVFSAAQAFESISRGPRGITFKVGRRFKSYYSNNPQGVIRQEWLNWVRRAYIFEQSEELSALRSIGLYDPLSLVWERLPWSFVIDWFVPIGTYLELIGQVPFLKGRFLRTTSAKSVYLGWYPESTFATVTSVPRCSSEDYKQDRVVLSSPPPVPIPRVKVAGAIQGRRVWNAIALAHQIFDKALRA